MMLSKHLAYFFAPSGRGPHWVSNSAPLPPPPSYLAYICPLFFTQAFYFSRRTIKPPVLCCFHRPWDGSLVSETWLPFTVHFVCILGDSGLDSDGEDGAKVNHMLAKAAQQTHIITEGTAASHGRRIKCEILFFIKFNCAQFTCAFTSLLICTQFCLDCKCLQSRVFFMFKIWSTVISACFLTFPTTTPRVTSTTTENSVTATRAL